MSDTRDTRRELVEELLKRPQSRLRDHIIERAKRGDYHDYRSTSSTPKFDLACELYYAGFYDLATGVLRGDYAEPPDREDLASLAERLWGSSKS